MDIFGDGDSDRDKDIEQTQIALGIQQTALAMTAESGPAASITAQGATIEAQTGGGSAGGPTPDLQATQVAASVQQTVAASGSAQIPATVPGGGGNQTLPTLTLIPQPPPPTPITPQAGVGFVNFTDNFIDPTSGWPIQNSGANQWYYANDHYYITVGMSDTQVAVSPGYIQGDGIVQTNVTVIQDQPKSYFGVICRMQDLNNYYFFEVGMDGYYHIGKLWNGQWSLIGMGQEKFTKAMDLTPGSYNEITAECRGNELTLYLHGYFVDKVYDNTFTSGSIGLSASTTGFPGLTVAFERAFAEE
jgi:hypothetical protein